MVVYWLQIMDIIFFCYLSVSPRVIISLLFIISPFSPLLRSCVRSRVQAPTSVRKRTGLSKRITTDLSALCTSVRLPSTRKSSSTYTTRSYKQNNRATEEFLALLERAPWLWLTMFQFYQPQSLAGVGRDEEEGRVFFSAIRDLQRLLRKIVKSFQSLKRSYDSKENTDVGTVKGSDRQKIDVHRNTHPWREIERNEAERFS